WHSAPRLDRKKPTNLFTNRGVGFARLGEQGRVFLGTLDGSLFALDARDGQPVKSFGNGGFIDLRIGVADKFPNRLSGMTSPPVVYKDLVICGSGGSGGGPQGGRGDGGGVGGGAGTPVCGVHVGRELGAAE